MQPTSGSTDPEQHLVNHVPDEVCVLVQAPADAEPSRVYDGVRTVINAALRAELSQPAPRSLPTQGSFAARASSEDALSADLEPATLRRRFGSTAAEILQPLERHGVSSRDAAADGVRKPWHILHAADGHGTAGRRPDGRATWHLYYAVGTQRVDFAAHNLETRLEHLASVRELVNLINRPAAGRAPLASGGQNWALVGASPNWLLTAAQMACGCPAGMPVPEPRSGAWPFRFDEQVEEALRGEPNTEIVVAILDTAPHSTSVPDHGNHYLAELLQAIHIHSAPDSSAALHTRYFDRPTGVGQYWESCLPWWHETVHTEDAAAAEFAIGDHGLFVAGVVHAVAPDAEIHLLRVLNDTGIGDGLGLGHILSELPRALNIGNGRRLIVNLSLGAAVPVPPRRHWGRWLPETRRSAQGALPRPDAAVQSVLDAAHASLLSTMNWLHRQGVLVVAAAGNDALRPATHEHDTPPPPRYPARYQEVLAVAATGADGLPASYSNRADVPPLGNGITCFGGEVEQADKPDAVAETTVGITGVYSADRLPDGQANTSGWVRWAGTSFSAPIIAGIAARLWSQHGELAPSELMQRIRGYAKPMPSGRAPNIDPDGPLDAPLLNVRQEYLPPTSAR
jgi:hypothetical protein